MRLCLQKSVNQHCTAYCTASLLQFCTKHFSELIVNCLELFVLVFISTDLTLGPWIDINFYCSTFLLRKFAVVEIFLREGMWAFQLARYPISSAPHAFLRPGSLHSWEGWGTSKSAPSKHRRSLGSSPVCGAGMGAVCSGQIQLPLDSGGLKGGSSCSTPVLIGKS